MKFAELTTQKAQTAHIRTQLGSSIAWASKGVIRIFENQTHDEQAVEATHEHNGIGFTGVDANILSSFAKQILKGRTMSPKQSAILFKKMPKYAGQLQRMVKIATPPAETPPAETQPTSTKLNVKAIDDDELLSLYHSLQGSAMYYHAAEGNYTKETDARNACFEELNEAGREVDRRGLL